MCRLNLNINICVGSRKKVQQKGLQKVPQTGSVSARERRIETDGEGSGDDKVAKEPIRLWVLESVLGCLQSDNIRPADPLHGGSQSKHSRQAVV